MSKDRDLVGVLSDMLAEVPNSQLVMSLHGLLNSAACTAPEDMRRRWWQTSQCLLLHFGRDESRWNTWQQRVVDIFTDRVSEEVKDAE